MKENEVNTVVGSSVRLVGTLKDTGDIVVHGTVEGEIVSEQNVVVAETASIKGPITARSVDVSGEAKGMVKALDKLEIHPSGRVEGNIQTKDLIIHSGAKFVGKSEILSDSQADAGEESPEIETADAEAKEENEAVEVADGDEETKDDETE